MVILAVAASVVAGIVAVDLFKSGRLKKKLAGGAPIPSKFDHRTDTSTNYGAIQVQANSANSAPTFGP